MFVFQITNSPRNIYTWICFIFNDPKTTLIHFNFVTSIFNSQFLFRVFRFMIKRKRIYFYAFAYVRKLFIVHSSWITNIHTISFSRLCIQINNVCCCSTFVYFFFKLFVRKISFFMVLQFWYHLIKIFFRKFIYIKKTRKFNRGLNWIKK